MKQLDSLRLLRGFAAIAIVIYHLEGSFSPGNIGVDIFFVMSGFLMMLVIDHNTNPVDFAISRVSRIVPNYWLFTIFVFILIIIKPDWFKNTPADFEFLIKSLFFIPFYKNPGSIHPIYTVGWTVIFEMFFYYFVLLSLLFPRILNSLNKRMMYVGFLFVFSFGVSRMLSRDYALVELLRSTIFFELLLGVITYYFYKNYRYSNQKMVWYIGLYMLGFMSLYGFHHSEFRFLVIGIPSSILLYCMTQLEPFFLSWNSKFKTLLCEIGDAGYSTYLVHLLIIFAMNKVIARQYPIFNPKELFGGTITLVVCLVAGSAIHHLFDKRAYKALRGWLHRKVDVKATARPQLQNT